jgi:acetate kinase
MTGDGAPLPDVVLTINGGSSSVKFAVFEVGGDLRRVVSGSVERVSNAADAVAQVLEVLRRELGERKVVGIGHRVVHGGLKLVESQRITGEVVAGLKEAVPLDLAHLPGEIALIEGFGAAFVGVEQVACLDTAFHREMPRVAQLLAIPRKYLDAGVRRFGFHGLSYAFLMQELERVAGTEAARGRVILAHLGNGASMAAVRGGKPVETTMGFTPLAGLVMGTRPGDMDAGLLTYLMREEKLTAEAMEDFLSRRCGMAGVSGGRSDMRDLLARRGTDVAAREAVELFCYSARKWIGALAAVMGGVDTVVFSGGIGEKAAAVRAEICAGLEFLGVRVDEAKNAGNAEVISVAGGGVTVRVIETDEEIMIARLVCDIVRGGWS